MATELTPCFKAYLLALTTPLRSQFRQMLNTAKLLLDSQVALLVQQIGRSDVSQALYKRAMDQLDQMLKPFEDAMLVIPFEALAGCPEGGQTLSNTQNIYFKYKTQAQDLAYKYAQHTFLSTAAAQAQEQYANISSQIVNVMDAIDILNTSEFSIGSRVMYYTTNQAGVVTDISFGNLITAQLDTNGLVTAPAGQFGLIGG